MAKTSGRTSDLKSLLTAAEKKLVDGTLGESLAAATKEQLAALRKQTRALRDKWLDLFKRQSIATKRKPVAAVQANARSREKSDVFSDAVKRIEARIAELVATVTAPSKAEKAKAPAAPAKRATKPQPTVAPEPAAVVVPRKTKTSTKPATSKKARQAGKRRALAAEGTGQPITFDVKKQRAAKARATVARLKIDGESTRRKGFSVSNTKRKQARRDSR